MRLSEKEKALLEKVREEDEVLLEDLDNVERGCLGKLMQYDLVEKVKDYENVGYEGRSLSKIKIVPSEKAKESGEE